MLPVIAAGYLLSAPLWAGEGPAGTGVGAGASHLLDGKTFVTQTGEKGKNADHQDIISFRDGRFISEGCRKYGFEAKSFTATVDMFPFPKYLLLISIAILPGPIFFLVRETMR